MGRRKIDIQPITQERNRAVTFAKRKNGLFKKAYELGVLCSVDVAVIIFEDRPGHDTKLHQYSSVDIRDIVQRQLRYQGEKDLRGPVDFSGASNVKDNEDEDGDEEYIRIDGDDSDEKPVSHPDPPAPKARGNSNAKGKRRKTGEKAKLPRDDEMDLQDSDSKPSHTYSSLSYPHSHSQILAPPPMHSSSSVSAGIGGLCNDLSTSNGMSSHLPVSNDRSSSVHPRPAKRQRSTLDSMDPGRRSPATVGLAGNVDLNGSGLGRSAALCAQERRDAGWYRRQILPTPGQEPANSILPPHSGPYHSQELTRMYQQQGPYASLFPLPSSSSPPTFVPLHTDFGPGHRSGSEFKRAGTAARSSFATDMESLPDIRSQTQTPSGGSGRYDPSLPSTVKGSFEPSNNLSFKMYAPSQPNSGCVASGGPASHSSVQGRDMFTAFLEADERSRGQLQSQSHDLEQPGGHIFGLLTLCLLFPALGIIIDPATPHDSSRTESWFDIFSGSNSGPPNSSSSWGPGAGPPNGSDIQAIFSNDGGGAGSSSTITRGVKPRSGGSDRGEAGTSRQGGFGVIAGSGKRGGRGSGAREGKGKGKKTPVRVVEFKRDDVDMGVPALGIDGGGEKMGHLENRDEGGARTPDGNGSAQVGDAED
ncbi:hypothetical protein GALMADRAFT_143289 [Galerina marginata CBS 339.88]|uniref:MADS-box domain-containing protein n=1 Tax=Galerina marginata (strain CBS 339.88) TaxID=685588 RepID=A0A067SPK9_GALM3|nr:hypothetical protein GALMADRAFT_143289 [Galerina marginata CBS 339.88]